MPKFRIDWAEGRTATPKWKSTVVEADTAEEAERKFRKSRPYHNTGPSASGITYGPDVTEIKE